MLQKSRVSTFLKRLKKKESNRTGAALMHTSKPTHPDVSPGSGSNTTTGQTTRIQSTQHIKATPTAQIHTEQHW
jgi:hypothetical protein